MPIYDYRCPACGHCFEELVRLGETPNCPSCGAGSPEKLPSLPAAPGRSQGVIKAARRAAAREGHLSNYTRSERQKLMR